MKPDYTLLMRARQYARRNVMGLGVHYLKHVMAMTEEELHSKSDIAAELAWRDSRIEALKLQVQENFKNSVECTTLLAESQARENLVKYTERERCLRKVKRYANTEQLVIDIETEDAT